MNIGIIGSGNIGANAARLFAQAGHDVAVSNSRGPESLEPLVSEIGSSARATTVKEVADFGEAILVAIPFFARDTLPSGLDGKIVIDATNYYPGRDGDVDFDGLTSSELLARNIPGARLVKAFNTMYYETLAKEGRSEGEDRLVLFVAGDDKEAKATVSGLIEEIGFAPMDTGSLRDGGRKQQPDSPIYNNPMTEDQANQILETLD